MAFHPNAPATSDIFVTIKAVKYGGSIVVRGRGQDADFDAKIESYPVMGAAVAPLCVNVKSAAPEGKISLVIPHEGPMIEKAILRGAPKSLRFYDIEVVISFIAKKPGLNTIVWEMLGAKIHKIPGVSALSIGADKVGGDVEFKCCQVRYSLNGRHYYVVGKEAA